MVGFEAIASTAVLLLGLLVLLLWLLDQYRRGHKRRAVLGAAMLAAFVVLVVADRDERTGERLNAVAVACKPPGFKTPASCTFQFADGLQESLPTPEWVSPGVRVVLAKARTRLTQRTNWQVAERAP